MSRLSTSFVWSMITLFMLTLLTFSTLFSLAPAAAQGDPPNATAQPLDPAAKVVFGIVESQDGQPVAGAKVIAHGVNRPHQAQTTTAADGSYKMELGPGLWAISVLPGDLNSPDRWIYPQEPQIVEFQKNDQPERAEVNFVVVMPKSAVVGKITLPDGSPPPFEVVIAFRNGEGHGGRTKIDPATGEFKLRLPPGRYDVFIHAQNDQYAAPQIDPIVVPPLKTVDLGTIVLLTRSATVSGQLLDQHGDPVAGITVIAWQGDRADVIRTRTDDNGRYALKLFAGRWHILPAPQPDQPYLYQGDGARVKVGPGETITDVDFKLLKLEARIIGVVVEEGQDEVLDVHGWAGAVKVSDPPFRHGAPIREGRFVIPVPAGDYEVAIRLAPGTLYKPVGPKKVLVQAGESVTVQMEVVEFDGAIQGYLIDPRRDEAPVTGVRGRVAGWSGDQWASTMIDPDTGRYAMRVDSGVWHTSYAIGHDGYAKLGGPANLPVQSGQATTWLLPITAKDGGISGRLLSPSGSPLGGEVVAVQGFGGDIAHLRLHTLTDDQGRFRIAVPHGDYRVFAPGGRPWWIHPVDFDVTVRPNGVVENVVLRFRLPNAALTGRVTVESGEPGNAVVWAWHERGGAVVGSFPLEMVNDQTAQGDYVLGVISEATWHVGGVFETDTQFWGFRTKVEVIDEVTVQNLVLEGPFPKPAPVAVTFDASEAQHLSLSDGTDIFVPAGAMPVSGEVTLRVIPLAGLPQQNHARLINYGYAFFATDENGRAIEATFNHNVTIRFPYDPPLVGTAPWEVKPAYFSTTTNEWTVPVSFGVDPRAGLVKMEIDHFTNFALLEGHAPSTVFLPSIQR